ncbi:PQQ-binding-like beta-propeller repeat protein [Streptomyces sp. NPDC046909]|uniref:outer membrane protein assembly factor BamB family protein n=1 Tax=Streptomyces sp. NPDC046909 TaxID=3155617 RepID=UPI0033CD26B1
MSGCSAGDPTEEGRDTTASTPAPSIPAASAPASAVPVQGPWQAWKRTPSGGEAQALCDATKHQLVCGTGADGLVGRSRTDGSLTWSLPATTPATGTDTDQSNAPVLDSADERALIFAGRVLRAANLRTGTQAWSDQLPEGREFVRVVAADGTVYALDTPTGDHSNTDVALGAYRASDGSALWHKSLDADPSGGLAAFGGRVYTTDGTQVTARAARTGTATASSPSGVECPRLLSGGGHLVCTGSPASASDVFPPLRRLDTTTLRPLATAEDSGMKPFRGLITADGVLLLYEDSAEDPGAGTWYAYDLDQARRLWRYPTTTQEGGVTDGRFVTFTPVNDPTKSRVISIDLHTGPDGTGAAAPRTSPVYLEARDAEIPSLVVPGGDAGHVVIKPRAHPALRSVPLP